MSYDTTIRKRWAAMATGCWLACILPAVASTWQEPVEVTAAAEQAVREALGGEGVVLQAAAEALDPRLKLPVCPSALETELPADLRTTARLTVTVRCGAATAWKIHVPVRVTMTRSLLVTARPLARGKVLADGDVILTQREVAAAVGGYFAQPGEAVGRVLRRNLPAGVILSPALLDQPVLVRRGQPVTLEARSGGIRVQIAGIARDDGVLGERIPVENPVSRKVVQGIVRNEKSVEVLVP